MKYDAETNTYHALYPPDEPYWLTYAIVVLVAEETGENPESMEPLFDTINPDALEKLFRSYGGETIRVEFTFNGCEVTALNDGEVQVTGLEEN